jgi:hypothetical protein
MEQLEAEVDDMDVTLNESILESIRGKKTKTAKVGAFQRLL